MQPPPVQYVTTSDGLSIAYAVSGQGRPLLFLPGTFDHVQLAWQYPGLGSWLEGLAAHFQLIQFDPRGTGMSTRGLTQAHTADAYQLDIEAVVEALKLDRFVIFGVAPGMRVATRYAFDHPERVSALVCESAGVLGRTPALFQSVPSQDWDWFLRSLVPRDANPEEARLRVELTKRAYDLEDFVLKMRASLPGSTGEYLAGLRVPTLVLHARDYALLSPEQAAEVAQVARGRMVLIEGSSAFGDADQGIRAIENFLADFAPEDAKRALPPDGLSSREVEVLHLITQGKSNQEIAGELVISYNTVIRHVTHILTKTGAANRAEAVDYAHRKGLVQRLP